MLSTGSLELKHGKLDEIVEQRISRLALSGKGDESSVASKVPKKGS